LTVTDVLSTELLGQIALSPDGDLVAMVVKRGRRPGESSRRDFLFDNDRADIWLAWTNRDAGAWNLTGGVSDASGYWNPVWSPDGRHLAMFSTKGGDNVRLYVWDRVEGDLRRVSDRPVHVPVSSFGFRPNGPLVWVSPTQLLCPMLGDGEQALNFRLETQAPDTATRMWARVRFGLEPTVSVLDSTGTASVRAPARGGPAPGQLVLWDLATSESRAVADGTIRELVPSPDGSRVAVVIETVPPPPRAGIPLPMFDANPARLGLLALDDAPLVAWVDGLVDPAGASGQSYPNAWSPDGRRFAVIGKRDAAQSTSDVLFVVDAETRSVQRRSPNDARVTSATWSTRGDLLAFGTRAQATRRQWYRVSRSEGRELEPLAGDSAALTPLIATPAPDRMVGLSAGALYSLDVRSGAMVQLLPQMGRVDAIRWPRVEHHQGRSVARLVVETTMGGGHKAVYELDLAGEIRATPISLPGADAMLAAQRAGVKVFSESGPNGTFVWSSDGRRLRRHLALNGHLAAIPEPSRRLVSYRNGDGVLLHALLLLPPGRAETVRHALVVSVYPGTIVREPKYFQAEKHVPSVLNLQLLTTRGIAVLIPSIPLADEGEPSDPALDITKSVMPAVEKTLELGVIDPDRLALVGQSYGGYGVYCLLTQTTRFHAAVVFGGASDLASLYGTFDARERYTDSAHESLISARFAERGQLRMGGPPWQDPARYMRNSPVFAADRIRTPLLIVQGDLDFVAMQQGEQMFTALYRLGRKARFLRYWGEGHGVGSPANIHDVWQRVFSWLDECWNSSS